MPAASEPSPVVVSYLGPEASYTHQAAQKAYPDSSTTQLAPQPTIPSLFQTIQDAGGQKPTLAVCPIENSTNGPVAATLDLFADPRRAWPDVHVVGEIRVPVRHCLIVSTDSTSTPAPPAADFRNASNLPESVKQHLLRIKSLYTHPQAWGQCTRFLIWLDDLRLEQGGAKVRRVDTSSTSHAASIVAGAGHSEASSTSLQKPMTSVDAESEVEMATDGGGVRADAFDDAAISSAATLALHPGSLAVLVSGLEDSAENVTRFVVLANRHADVPVQQLQRKSTQGSEAKQKALVTFSLTSPSASDTTGIGEGTATASKPPPGALAKSLAVFEKRGMTLTSIAARPSGRAPWDYVFVVEVEILDQGEQTSGLELVEQALQDVRAVAGEARCCGVWWFDESEAL